MAVAALALLSASAQKVHLKVGYVENYRNWTNAPIKNDFVLLVSDEESRYYNPMTQIVDSMLSTPQGTAHFNSLVQAANDAGHAPELLPVSRTFVFKNYKDKTMRCYEEPAGEFNYYIEAFDEQNWQVTDSTKTILGYECFMAEADYHGRHWKAWFTPEVPVQEGPWKFCGLPGLILEMSADNGAYKFRATGLETVNIDFPKVYGQEGIKQKDRIKMLRRQWDFYTNGDAEMTALTGKPFPKFPLPEGFDLIETDYK